MLEPPFAPECCPMFALYAQTNKQITPFALRCFSSPLVRPTFSAIFPWFPLSKISENGRFRCPCKISHNWALRALLEPPLAPECCPIVALKLQTNEQITLFALRRFSSPLVRPTFSAIFPWSFSTKSPKMGDLGFLAKSLITGLCRQFWSRRFRQNVVQCLHFTCSLMSRSRHLR